MSTHLQGHFFSAQGGDDPPLFGPVNLYVKHGKYRFSREDGMLIETAVDAWERQSIFRKSVSQNVWLYRKCSKIGSSCELLKYPIILRLLASGKSTEDSYQIVIAVFDIQANPANSKPLCIFTMKHDRKL
ncbi:uncharacterized protein RSE6_07631 [Rhynchosporium secalis]|uniref:Uncharacterized protein n=1 Tax=Rhynchosporium secalis TaxID=38038 RepID=A0A1E1MDD0_RHYSE|nr:uncharacterized protein RSE6_07631 [Rhynchosporium secalis]